MVANLSKITFFAVFLFTAPVFAQGLFDLNPHRPKAPLSRLSNPDNWMAIVGDSGTTGAASNHQLKPNVLNLLGHVVSFIYDSEMTAPLPPLSDYSNPSRFGITSVDPMTRVLYSKAEFEDAAKGDGVVQLNLQSKASLAVDMPEHGNGYMIGRALGIAAQDIVIVSQDGKRVSAIPDQFARIYEMQTSTLPPLVLVSFTANDFCDNGVFTDSLEQRRARFAKSLAKSWEEAAPYLRAHPRGTRIIVLPALEVANVLTNRRLLQQKVDLQGMGRITCEQMRENSSLNGFLTQKVTSSLGNMCKAVLFTRPSDTERIERIREVQNEFNDVWKKQIDFLNQKYRNENIEWMYVESLRSLRFSTGDLANDCFHPGVGGHAKIADYVLRTVFGQ